jgi:SpoVK/Ycf46/Vps4 family AAA+-type ATPase
MAVNTFEVSPGEALLTLRAAWDAKLKVSFMLHGAPGVGKTQIVEQLARRIGGRLYDVRLTTIDPSDLRGLPYYDHETRRTVFFRPEDLPEGDAPAVLFLDELSAASPSLQPTVYGLLQERRVGRHRIPDNVMIVGAGNRVEDGAGAYEMGTAIADRLIHLNVASGADDWLTNFAVPNGLHPAVIAFVRTRPDLLETTDEAMRQGHMIATTPRSWERVSQIMRAVPDRRARRIMIAGTIGDARCAEFMMVADDVEAAVGIDTLIATPRAARAALYPDTLHGLNALVFGLVGASAPETLEAQIEILLDLRRLRALRPDEDRLARLPLEELSVGGFEMLFARAIEMGLQEAILRSPAYADYMREREAIGLDAPAPAR